MNEPRVLPEPWASMLDAVDAVPDALEPQALSAVLQLLNAQLQSALRTNTTGRFPVGAVLVTGELRRLGGWPERSGQVSPPHLNWSVWP